MAVAGGLASPTFLHVVPGVDAVDIVTVQARADSVTALRWSPDDPDRAVVVDDLAVGFQPTHVALDAQGEFGVVCAYGDGAVTTFIREPDGTIGARATSRRPPAKGMAQSRAHGSVVLDDHIVTTDLGLDRIVLWRRRGAAQVEPVAELVLPGSSAPRHLVRHPSGMLLVACERSGALAIVAQAEDSLELVDLVSLTTVTAPDAAAAGIALSPDGRHAYVGLRERGGIAVVALRPDGTVPAESREGERIGWIRTGGTWQRHHAVVGDLLIVAHEHSDDVSVLRLDPGTGLATETLGRASMGSPSCIVPLPRLGVSPPHRTRPSRPVPAR